MPKKGKSGSLGRKTAKAKIMAKKREDEDYAAEEKEKQRELMVLRRQHSDEREKQRLYEEERRKSKKFRDKEREKDKGAHRESRDSMLARKKAEEEQQVAQIREIHAKRYYRNIMMIKTRFNLPSLQGKLGFDWQKYWAMTTKEEKISYSRQWHYDLLQKDLVEWFRWTCENIWGQHCPDYLQHSSTSICLMCESAVDQIGNQIGSALHFRDSSLSLSREWSNKAIEIIKEGPQCIICMDIPVPIGISVPNAPYCERCEIGREVRAKLIDFWNHLHEERGITTKFSFHKEFECVCEKEVVRWPPRPNDYISEESSQEEEDKEEEEETSEEEEEEEETSEEEEEEAAHDG